MGKEYRLLLYSALIGVAGGLGAQLFVWLLNFSERLLLVGIAGYKPPEPGTLNPQPVIGPWGLWLIPVATTLGGLLSGLLVYTFAPEAEGHGTDAAVESFHFKGGKIRPLLPFIKAVASAIPVGSGRGAGVGGESKPPIFYGIRDLFRSLKIPNHVKPAIGGLLMGLLAIIVPETISTGYGWVQKAMTGDYIGWALIFLALAKILAMSLTISSGGSGGVFCPNVYIGGMVGAWIAFVTDKLIPGAGLSTAAFAVVGMAAVFAGSA